MQPKQGQRALALPRGCSLPLPPTRAPHGKCQILCCWQRPGNHVAIPAKEAGQLSALGLSWSTTFPLALPLGPGGFPSAGRSEARRPATDQAALTSQPSGTLWADLWLQDSEQKGSLGPPQLRHAGLALEPPSPSIQLQETLKAGRKRGARRSRRGGRGRAAWGRGRYAGRPSISASLSVSIGQRSSSGRQGSCGSAALQGSPSSQQTVPRTCTDPSGRPPGDADPRERAGGSERVSVLPLPGTEEGPPELPGVPQVPEGHARQPAGCPKPALAGGGQAGHASLSPGGTGRGTGRRWGALQAWHQIHRPTAGMRSHKQRAAQQLPDAVAQGRGGHFQGLWQLPWFAGVVLFMHWDWVAKASSVGLGGVPLEGFSHWLYLLVASNTAFCGQSTLCHNKSNLELKRTLLFISTKHSMKTETSRITQSNPCATTHRAPLGTE